MRRREFLSVLGGAASWPVVARAQQGTVPVVGFLSGGSPGSFGHAADAFRRGLAENGFGPGRIAIEQRWAEGQADRLRALADDLIRAQVVLIGAGGPAATLAAKAATSTIPIVFTSGEDPIKLGLVTSYNQPGGNVTGIAILTNTLGAKRLGLVRELVPTSTNIAALLDPSEPSFDTQMHDFDEAARALGLQLHVLSAKSDPEIEGAFARAKELGVGAMLVGLSFFYAVRREQIAAMALRHGMPTIFGQREYATAGGLMSYGTDLADAYFQAGSYAAKILKGGRPADLPVVQAAKFQLIINQKTAKTLGLAIPSGIISIADEVIE